jgi:tubulin-specific chaperone E
MGRCFPPSCNASSSRLSSWSNVDAFATYPLFANLRLTNIPLFSGKGASEIRPEVIARVSCLSVFNASPITPKERIDAERAYLRKMLRQKQSLERGERVESDTGGLIDRSVLENGEFEVLHPRYTGLFGQYGEEIATSMSSSTGGMQTLASEMILVTLHNLSFSGNGSLEPVQKRLPASLTVDKLRLLVKQLYRVEPRLQRLSIRQYKNAMPVLMDDDDASIRYYGAIDSSDIFINEEEDR